MKKIAVNMMLLLAVAGLTSAQPYSFTAQSADRRGKTIDDSYKTVGRRPVNAGISQGDSMVSLMLGVGVPLGDSGIDIEESSKPKWGGAGFNYGLSYLYFVNESLGLGFEVSGMNTANATKDYSGLGYSEHYTNSMDLFNAMLTGRINVNPQEEHCRVYFPFGAGFTSAKGTFKVKAEDSYYGSFDERYSATTTSLGYFLGLGFESTVGDIDNRISVGLEMRYNGFAFDTDKLISNHPLNGKKHYSYLSFLLKVGYRF
ncbi:MAG: outer membrane beta-barrel protein [Elusimicrobiaceae bacterium]|nr:outer membrane beta-barrel protein [Elusimicrobiaceae bacterium]